MTSVMLKAKSFLKNKIAIRYIAAGLLLAAACVLALTLNQKNPSGSIEMYGLSVKMPKGVERAEILEGGSRAVLYKDDTIVGGVKLLRYSLQDTDGITVEKDAKQVGRRVRTEEEEMYVIQARFERPYPKDSGKTGSYIEKHICLVPAGSGEYVYDFYEVEKAARKGTAEYMRKNWVTMETAPRPGEGWTELFVNLDFYKEEQRLANMGTESKYKDYWTVAENEVVKIVGNKNDFEAYKESNYKDIDGMYYYPGDSDTISFQNPDGTYTTFADFYFTLRDNRCLAVRCLQPVQQDQDGVWAAIGWREYQPADIEPIELVKDGKLISKETLAYTEGIYHYEEKDGEKTPVFEKYLSHNVQLLDDFTTLMFEEKPCQLIILSAYTYDGELRTSGRNKLLKYDGTKALCYNLFHCIDGKYRCYLPIEFSQLSYGTTGSGLRRYSIQPTDVTTQQKGIFVVYE